ncbi:MAG: methyltransferase domain-containing protein [Acidimicrobiia bacterium]
MEADFARHYYEVASGDHWWFRGRKALVGELVNWAGADGLALDIGAGSSTMLPRGLTTVRLDTVVPSPHGDDRFIKASAIRLPIRSNVFNFVGLFDVVEHIEDVSGLLSEVARVLVPHGWLIVTVPAHQWLWSKHDEQAHHLRRYSEPMLFDTLEQSDFTVLWSGQFYGFLVLPALMRRILGLKGGVGLPMPIVNALLTGVAERSTKLALRRKSLGLSIGLLAHKAS